MSQLFHEEAFASKVVEEEKRVKQEQHLDY